MDESVELFHAEQRRLAEQGGPLKALGRTLGYQALGLAACFTIMWALMSVLSLLPRNADNSMKVMYYGPVFGFLAIVSAVLLSSPAVRRSPLQYAAWLLILLALVAIPAGIYDEINRL